MPASMSQYTPLIPTWNQRDPQWANQRLGIQGSSVTLGQSGCLITSIAMMNAGFSADSSRTPNVIDDLFSANPRGNSSDGYVDYNLVIWNAINRLLPECVTAGADYCSVDPAPIEKIKSHLFGGGLAILQVGFGGNPTNMHFLLAVGYEDNEVIFNDPWYGDQSRFSSRRYGSGSSAADILAVHYFADGNTNTPVKPPSPIAARPAENPVPTPPAPVEEPVPTPTPEAPVGTVETPAPEPVNIPTSEWVSTWRPQPEKERSVTNPLGAKVVDMDTSQVVTILPLGYPIKDIAGFSTFQNTEWARTQWAVDNNRWTMVRATDLSSPTLEIPVVKKDIDNIFTDISPQALESSFVDLATEIKQNSSNLAALRIHLSAVLAILLSPILRKLGRKQ